MIIKKRKNGKLKFSRKEKGIGILIVVVIGFFSPYAGFFIYAMEEYNLSAYNLDPPDPGSFVTTNSSLLYSMAMWFENNIVQYHLPHDMIVNTIFNSSEEGGSPIAYTVTYDSAEWTGHYLMAEAYRYAVHIQEGNYTLANETLININNTSCQQVGTFCNFYVLINKWFYSLIKI